MNVYKGRFFKKSSNRKSKLVLSTHGFQTSHFICDQFGCKLSLRSIQNYALHRFQAFACRNPKSLRCSIRRRIWADALPWKGRRYRPTALHRIRNMWFCSYIFLLRDEWMIERFSEAMGSALVCNNFSPILWKFHFTWKKRWFVTARNLQSIKPYWLLNWVSIARMVACFPQASWLLHAATAPD